VEDGAVSAARGRQITLGQMSARVEN
jgi:hypothetical protein